MANINHHQSPVDKRKSRVRSKLFGTAKRPRLTVYRSNHYTYLQAINDEKGETVAAASDITLKDRVGTKTERAIKSAQEVAEQLKSKKIKSLVFDRGSYRYHGRVKEVANALRAAGLKF